MPSVFLMSITGGGLHWLRVIPSKGCRYRAWQRKQQISILLQASGQHCTIHGLHTAMDQAGDLGFCNMPKILSGIWCRFCNYFTRQSCLSISSLTKYLKCGQNLSMHNPLKFKKDMGPSKVTARERFIMEPDSLGPWWSVSTFIPSWLANRV